MYFIYVLKSRKDGLHYYGMTQDLKKRLEEHNMGAVKSTRTRKPFDLIYYETAGDASSARKREKYFKSGFGRKYVQDKIEKRGPIV